MRGNEKVIELLNGLLAGELTAMDQYFLHSRMCLNMGFKKLYEHINHEMEEETGHAEALINRILFLEGEPDMSKRAPLTIGKTVPDMIQNDLELEYAVATALKEAMAHCESVRDYVTRDILSPLLKDTEEDHTYWLETQLKLIKAMGLQNYLQSQS